MFSQRATFQVNKCEVQMEFGFSSRSALTLSLPWGAQNSCSKRVLTLSHCPTESKSKREEITGFALEKETAHGRGGVPWLEEWFFTRTVRPEPFPGLHPRLHLSKKPLLQAAGAARTIRSCLLQLLHYREGISVFKTLLLH